MGNMIYLSIYRRPLDAADHEADPQPEELADEVCMANYHARTGDCGDFMYGYATQSGHYMVIINDDYDEERHDFYITEKNIATFKVIVNGLPLDLVLASEYTPAELTPALFEGIINRPDNLLASPCEYWLLEWPDGNMPATLFGIYTPTHTHRRTSILPLFEDRTGVVVANDQPSGTSLIEGSVFVKADPFMPRQELRYLVLPLHLPIGTVIEKGQITQTHIQTEIKRLEAQKKHQLLQSAELVQQNSNIDDKIALLTKVAANPRYSALSLAEIYWEFNTTK